MIIFLKNIFHFFKAVFANCIFLFPGRKIYVIGITGTNGKTTTTQMIARILEKSGKKVAVSSTINFKIGEKEWVNKTKFTTLSAWKMQQFLKEAIRRNCEVAVLEISSHSLEQSRVWGVGIDCAVITNISREHLDYHKTIEKYTQAKEKLFKMLEKNFSKKIPNYRKISVVNLEMDQFNRFLKYQADLKFGYFKEKNSNQEMVNLFVNKRNNQVILIKGEEIRYDFSQTFFKVNKEEFKINLLGDFNVENALAAIAVGTGMAIKPEIIKEALLEIKKIPGRLDFVENKLGIEIIIDYAVTPDSMEKLGKLIFRRKQVKPNQIVFNSKIKSEKLLAGSKPNSSQRKIIWVFGSCGRRDVGKRPLMGEVVANFADYAIVTNEDPYDEDPIKIMQQVFSGLIRKGKIEGKNAWIIPDRREAIRKALCLAQKNDIILVTGKGAEETMAVSKKKVITWNDRKVIEEELKKVKRR